jgi:hypothetical protein
MLIVSRGLILVAFLCLQDFVDQHLISSSQPPAIKPVMGGRFVQQIICRGHDFTSEREEDFYQISVDVKGMGSLQKSLDDYVKVRLHLFLTPLCVAISSMWQRWCHLCVCHHMACGSWSYGRRDGVSVGVV